MGVAATAVGAPKEDEAAERVVGAREGVGRVVADLACPRA